MGDRDGKREGRRSWPEAAAARRNLPAGPEICGEVLFTTVTAASVQLDVVADTGPLPIGTPFVVTAELPGGFLGAVVDSVVRRWTEDGVLVRARVSRYAGHTRVDLHSATTRVVLDVDSVAVPTSRAA